MKYYQHKENKTVICEAFSDTVRFTKWKWKGNVCNEEHVYKELTTFDSFNEITLEEFNHQWGVNLQNA